MNEDDAERRVQLIEAETRAGLRSWELVEALQAAIAGDSHWRSEAQQLLREIWRGKSEDTQRG